MTRNALLPYAPCRADLSRRSYNEGGSFSVGGCLQPQAKRSFNLQLAEGYSLRPTLFAFPPCPMLFVGTGLIGLASLGKKKFGN